MVFSPISRADVTTRLQEDGYVPSYNIPAFPRIFDISGYGPAGFNYTTDPRAQIFRRDHVKVRCHVCLALQIL
eukprot:m.169989 g.169989  ORF g.169989 m.169989 type:complete len:73 (+) comp16483_c1_seq3:134-352(+)